MATEKGSLALLDRAVQGAIDLELGKEPDKQGLAELGILPKRTRLVAGLKLTANATRDAKADPAARALLKRLSQYAKDYAKLQEELAKVDVTPIATVPLVAWEHICDTSGLYRFAPDGDTVRFNEEKILEEVRPAAETEAMLSFNKLTMCLAAGSLAMITGASIGLHFLGDTRVLILGLLGGIVGLVGSLLNRLTGPSDDTKARKIMLERIPAIIEKHEKAGTLVSQLWPNLREPKEGLAIRIALPDPPEDVQQTLLAVERTKFKLHIAVVAAAIGFKESVTAVMTNQAQARWAEADLQAMLNSDPIAYVRHGTAVAIIAQYGDFPIEKEVMLQVLNSEHLA